MDMVTVTEAARLCQEGNVGISKNFILSLVKQDEISYIKCGVKVLINFDGLSEKNILHYHRLVSAILSQATRDHLIPYNIADKNYTKAPRISRKEANFLDDNEV